MSTLTLKNQPQKLENFLTGFRLATKGLKCLLPGHHQKILKVHKFTKDHIWNFRSHVLMHNLDIISGTNLFITNLPKNTTTKNIYDWFGRFGKIVQHNILVDKVTNEPRGVGFVR